MLHFNCSVEYNWIELAKGIVPKSAIDDGSLCEGYNLPIRWWLRQEPITGYANVTVLNNIKSLIQDHFRVHFWLTYSIIWNSNSPYACLRQTSKFHHQVSFSKYKVAKFCINEFPGQYSWKEYPRIKSANAKNFAFKRGLVVKFARLTQSRIRAIPH